MSLDRHLIFHLLSGALLIGVLSAGCASDNVHQPEPEVPLPAPNYFTGVWSSDIPDFPTFPAVVLDNGVEIRWLNADRTLADVSIGSFDLYVSVVDLNVSIGQMNIDQVVLRYGSDGVASLSRPDFECQAGTYFTTGSLEGVYDPSTGILDLDIMYKPGAMPFTVHSSFSNNLPS